MENLFIIAGAQRSGTTFLYHILDAHPEIYMAKPIKPEPKFFCNSEEYCLGKEYYINKYFSVSDQYRAYGEKSTSYMTTKDTPINIYRMFPKAKLIFLLRNPIERAISNYWFSVKNKLETESFEYAIKNEEKRLMENPMPGFSNHPFAYLTRGKYVTFIYEFFKYFPRENILFIRTEDLMDSLLIQIKKIYTFLNVSSNFVPNIESNKVNTAEREENVLTMELKNYLIEYFRNYNRELEKLIDIDLSEWNRL